MSTGAFMNRRISERISATYCPPGPTAYEQGLLDGAANRQTPSRAYATSATLCAWWRGWQVGHSGQATLDLQALLPPPLRRKPQTSQWRARREEYLREKAVRV